MVKKLLTALVFILLAVAATAAMQPDDFSVSRSITVDAPPSTIFSQVNNLRKWDAWSPWAKLDPDAKITFEGPEEGVGAVMRWAGNREVGEGALTVTESRTAEKVTYRLDFVKPFAGTNESGFTLKPEGSGTQVVWDMTGHKNFFMKVMGLFMNCEKMVGEQFEQGLTQLKAVAEGQKAG